MKLIEALKKIKDLERKADDIVQKISKHSAITSMQTPEYKDQKKQVREWVQAHHDIIKEIENLRVRIQKTNLNTLVTVELGGQQVEKTIAAWIHRRRDLAKKELLAWSQLTDRGMQEASSRLPSGDIAEIKIVRFYDPEERDKKKEEYASEPLLIDARLEVANAVTDLLE